MTSSETPANARILVVEDEGIVAKDIQNTLKGLGYGVSALASSGEEAIDKAAETHPDLVLMDIALKGEMDGVEAAEQIRARFDIPVVYLTAYSDKKTLQRAKIAEPYGYILKPFPERELHSNIEMALYKHKAEQQIRASLQEKEVLLKELRSEHKQTVQALRDSENRYRGIFEGVQDAIFVESLTGQILDVNARACEMFGWSREEFLTKTVSDLVAEGHVALVPSELVGHEMPDWPVETVNLRANGEPFPAEITGRLQTIGEETVLLVVVRDITERKRSEEEIRHRNRELEALNAIAQVVSESLDLNRILDQALVKTLEVMGLAGGEVQLFDEATGKLSRAVHCGLRPTILKLTEEAAEILFEAGPRYGEPTIETADDHPLTAEGVHEAGGPVWRAAVPLLASGESRGMLIFSDLEARELAPEELSLLVGIGNLIGTAVDNARLFEQVRAGRNRLQAISRRLLEVQEVERRNIARELHDEIGQILTGLKITLDMSQRLPPDAVSGSLREAEELVSDLIGRVRQLSLDLRPAMLDDLGLLPALLWHLERYQSQTQIQVTFGHTGLERRFDPGLETAAYRIVQEALTNVARHADVSAATVRVWSDESKLNVQIEDQGSGFDPEAVLAAGASSGLVGMRERANSLGGQLTVESTPDTGTRLTVDLPLGDPLDRRRSTRSR